MGNSNKKYDVKKSKIQGDGAFAKQNLNPGDYIGKVHTILQPYVNYEFTELGRKHNHSDNPNVQNVLIGNERHLVAVKPIKKGQELKSNYRLQPDLEQPEDFKKAKTGKKLSPSKAKEILHDKSVHGHPLTDKQRRFFGAIAGGAPIKAQDGLSFEGAIFNALHKKGDYPKERQAVIDELSNLPIYSPDARYASYQEALPMWKTAVENVPVQVSSNHPAGKTGSAYYNYGAPVYNPAFPHQGNIYLDPRQEDALNTPEKVLKHEMRHAAFDGSRFIPQWYGDALYNTSRNPEGFERGDHQDRLTERAAMTLGTRKAIIDKYGLKPNAKIPRDLFDAYNREIMETGLRQGSPLYQENDIQETFGGARNASDVYDIINFNYPSKQKNGGWLDKYNDGGPVQENYNDYSISTPPGFVGMGNNTQGRNYSPAWGGQFAMGGSLPGSVGFTYARTNSPAPSEGPYAKKTLPSAEHGMSYYQHGLDWKPKTISKNGGWLDKYAEGGEQSQEPCQPGYVRVNGVCTPISSDEYRKAYSEGLTGFGTAASPDYVTPGRVETLPPVTVESKYTPEQKAQIARRKEIENRANQFLKNDNFNIPAWQQNPSDWMGAYGSGLKQQEIKKQEKEKFDEQKRLAEIKRKSEVYFTQGRPENEYERQKRIQQNEAMVQNMPYAKLDSKGNIVRKQWDRDEYGKPLEYTRAYYNDRGLNTFAEGLEAAGMVYGAGEVLGGLLKGAEVIGGKTAASAVDDVYWTGSRYSTASQPSKVTGAPMSKYINTNPLLSETSIVAKSKPNPAKYVSDFNKENLAKIEELGVNVKNYTPNDLEILHSHALGSTKNPEALNQVILKNKIKNPTTIRRGISKDYDVQLLDPKTYKPLKDKSGKLITKKRSQLSQGDVFKDENIMSTSYDLGSKHGSIDLSEIIEIPGGGVQSFAYPNINMNAPAFAFEKEVVLPKGLIRKVKSVNDGKSAKYTTEILNPYKNGGWLDKYK